MSILRRTEAAEAAAAAAAELRKRATQAEEQLLRAENKLHELGHERKPEAEVNNFSAHLLGYDLFGYDLFGYRKTEAAKIQDSERRHHDYVEIAERLDAAHAQGRTEALKTVIEALELKDYGYRKLNTTTGSQELVDHLWYDLNTALKVRAERAAIAACQATETKITRLTKDAHAVGDRVYLVPVGNPAAPTVDDFAFGTSFGTTASETTPAAATAATPPPKAKKGAKK